MLFTRAQSDRFSSLVEPATTQMEAPPSSLAAVQPERLAQQEALAVEEADGGEVQPVGGVAPLGPGDGADQHVDLAGLQRRQPRRGGQRHPADLGGVAERGGGDGAAEVVVDAAVLAPAVRQGEAGGAGRGAADQHVARLHRGQGRPGAWACARASPARAEASRARGPAAAKAARVIGASPRWRAGHFRGRARMLAPRREAAPAPLALRRPDRRASRAGGAGLCARFNSDERMVPA